MMVSTPEPETSTMQTLYARLGVQEECSNEELTRAFRQKALLQHPDKGGDAGEFDELKKAYSLLGDDKTREAYDDNLAKARDRATLVEGGRPMEVCGTTATKVSAKQAQGPLRAKTEPQWGSKRQAKMRCSEPGKPQMACAPEWKHMGSGAGYLKMLTDDVSEEHKTKKLLEKYVALPASKEKKREWIGGLRGKEKQDLKLAAKKLEEAERAKWAKWMQLPEPKAKAAPR